MAATMPNGAPAWVDSVSTDFRRDRDFYTGLFGWSAVGFGAEVEYYVDFHLGDTGGSGRAIAGLVGASPAFLPGVPSRWTVYFRVAECADAVARAIGLGATVVMPASPVGEDLVYALLEDPAGFHFGLFEIRSDGAGLQASGVRDAPVWYTFAAADLTGPLDCYRRLLGWTISGGEDADEPLAAASISAPGASAPFAGVSSEEAPVGWTVFYGVDSVEATTARAVALGGAIVKGPYESAGRNLAEIAAPSGARFGVAAKI
ncbi:VOC family protein [Glycomyces sp. NPDC049804]|uniref:VOC family protein n=1 Tax=Glycomyces sp. NPDC049804 TaxID=3154363 RepID=UPI00343EE175